LPGQIAESAIVPTVVRHATAGARWTAWQLRAADTNDDNMFQLIHALHQQQAWHGYGLFDELDGVHSSTVANSSMAAPRVREIPHSASRWN
jgi:hypothetical protein